VAPSTPASTPAGDVHDWYVRGLALLQDGNAAAATALLRHAAREEPASRSVLEALARAEFDSGDHAGAARDFAAIVAQAPTDDYAHFGLGLAAERTGELGRSAEHLALAVAMRPSNTDYDRALRRVRAKRRRLDG
jgi:Flp pilus assembly protein TadD